MTHASPTLASLYDIPAIYDRIMQPGPCEPFYDDLARRTGGPVLDLACGTGRLTIPLASRGHDAVGLDSSATMLGQARRKAAELGAALDFVEGDMRCFTLDRAFPLILITCNSLAHLASREDLLACLGCAARHLAPGGTLAVDVVNPDVRALARTEPTRLDLGPNPSTAIAVEEWASYDPVLQLRELRWRIREPNTASREIAPLVLRQFFPQELPLLFEAAGLDIVSRYGDFASNPLTEHSLNQICLAQLRRGAKLRPSPAVGLAPEHIEGRLLS